MGASHPPQPCMQDGKVDMLAEENQRLNQLELEKMTEQMQNMQGNSSESIVNNCSSSNPSQDYDSSDTSLKLGLPFLEY